MNYKTISEMFVGTTDRCSEKKLFYYKKDNDWIGLNGRDILITVEDISFGLRSLAINPNSNIAISAQFRLHDFYSNLGFKKKGEVYLEDDIEHIKMVLDLKNKN